ncbi:hypothetical protein FUAX_12300 [Fulvitalea axinellae]|uniref:LysM domain-containing protein n=1 Tax=Fulvitalea axinellae TaxID=1182444 RepID=A0AAU9CYR4_9BACT|nr:hypothetical protein FUAX_12300 [Fulvitalea axinellae]
MRYLLILALCISAVSGAFAQTAKVPSTMTFADMKLTLTPAARKEIQKNVDQLYTGGKFLDNKLERVKTYGPLVKKHLGLNGVPEDFKYLVIQESDYIADAVSSSNAVGFWQFKKPAAVEMGLRVDFYVDERLNIVSSTIAAAGYLKKHNRYLDNWVHTLLSYNTGLGGVKRHINSKNRSRNKMEITKKTHWYVKKTLAHKIAFEDMLKRGHSAKVYLEELENGRGKSMKDIAKQNSVDYDLLKDYNPWLKRGSKTPKDKDITILLPLTNAKDVAKSLEANQANPSISYQDRSGDFPIIKEYKRKHAVPQLVEINGLPGIVAQPGDNLTTLAIKGNVSESRLLKYNELEEGYEVQPEDIFYLKKKKRKAEVAHHTVKPGETILSVSQLYGMRTYSIRWKNRLKKGASLRPGRVLWLRKRRPRKVPVEYRSIETGDKEEELTLLDGPADEPKTVNKPAKEGKKTSVPQPTPVIEPTPQTSVGSGVEKPVAEQGKKPQTYQELFARDEKKRKEIENQDKPKQTVTEEPSKPIIVRPVEVNQPESGESSVVYHTVKQGDTPYSLSRKYGTTVADLFAMNGMASGDPIQLGQVLRVRKGNGAIVPKPTSTVKEKPSVEVPVAGKGTHTVLPKETLYGIARKYGVTVAQLKEWNSLADGNLAVGQTLQVSTTGGSTSATNAGSSKANASKTHTVQAGEYLYGIARKYGVSVGDLKEWNSLTDGNVSIGQVLKLSPSAKVEKKDVSSDGGEVEFHVVQAKETLYSIARKYGVSVADLKAWNSKTDNSLSLGEKLMIKK